MLAAILKILREAECFFGTIFDYLPLSVLASTPKSVQEVPLAQTVFADSNSQRRHLGLEEASKRV